MGVTIATLPRGARGGQTGARAMNHGSMTGCLAALLATLALSACTATVRPPQATIATPGDSTHSIEGIAQREVWPPKRRIARFRSFTGTLFNQKAMI